MKTGIELITDERQRQISKEGWTPEHDDEHTAAEMIWAANCYTYLECGSERAAEIKLEGIPPTGWPWGGEWWKPSEDPVRNLVKAGALIAAEIDRLQRLNREITSLYRVQHPKDGRGPFRPGLSHEWVDDEGEQLPTVFHQFPLSIITRPEPPNYRKGCAVRNLETLVRWFTPNEQQKLQALGYHLVQLHYCEILCESPEQILFRRPHSHTEKLTILAWPSPSSSIQETPPP